LVPLLGGVRGGLGYGTGHRAQGTGHRAQGTGHGAWGMGHGAWDGHFIHYIMIKILGIKIIDRIKEAGLTQGVLSKHASVITTRMGFHEVTDEVCSREAYIIIHLNGDPSEYERLEKDLEVLGGIEIREMVFNSENEPQNNLPGSGNVEILGLLVERAPEVVISVQKIFTSYGCNIRTRLGVNEVFFGQPAGMIILELKGDIKQRLLLERDLKSLQKVHVRTMVF